MEILNYKVLMRRTLANLDFLKKHDRNEPDHPDAYKTPQDNPPYAVTERVNSYLGAFAHVYDETLGKEYKQVGGTHAFSPVRQMPNDWPTFHENRTIAPGKHVPIPDNLGERCRRVRNALAHGNLRFEINSKIEIANIHLWTNSQQVNRPIDWGGFLTVAEFESLLRKFCEFIESTFDDSGNPK